MNLAADYGDDSLTEEELNLLINVDELEVDYSDIDEPTEEELENIDNLTGGYVER